MVTQSQPDGIGSVRIRNVSVETEMWLQLRQKHAETCCPVNISSTIELFSCLYSNQSRPDSWVTRGTYEL